MAHPTDRFPSVQPSPRPVGDPSLTANRLSYEGWVEGAPAWADTSPELELCETLVCGACDHRGLALVAYRHDDPPRWRAFASCPACGVAIEI